MMGPQHRLLGAVSGAGLAHAAGQPAATVILAGVTASATSHGWASPDIDQTAPVRAVAGLGPLRHVLGHRGLTHWWGLPIAALLWGIPSLPASGWLVSPRGLAVLLLVGWVSHLAGDLVFGHLPLLPWGGWRLGLGLRTGGAVEETVVRWGLAAALVWIVAGTPSLPQ